jgi:4-amino-4-deoxy-L-arabinose transferase-like glycosyltransferase
LGTRDDRLHHDGARIAGGDHRAAIVSGDLARVARRVLPYAVFSAAIFLIALWEHHAIFPALSWNRDEPVYLWQMHALRAGHFITTDGNAPEFLQPWLTGRTGGGFYSQYTLGWPLVLLVGDMLGSPAFGTAFGVLLAVLGTYALAREITRDRTLAFVAALALFVSPIIPIQGGVYVGYLFTLGIGTLFAAALLSGVREARRWKVIVAGGLLGWIFLTRPFDAVLWGVAVVGYIAFDRRRELRTLLRWAMWFTAGLLPFVAVASAYNLYVTGKLTEFPITAATPLDTFGFGLRQIARQAPTTDYTVTEAIRSTGKNGFFVPLFLSGTYLGALVAGWGLWLRRRERTSLLLLAIILVFPVGYFFFWGMHVSAITVRMSGPIYFVPMYAPLCILIAHVLVTWWRRRPVWALLLVASLVVATVPFAWNRIALNHDVSTAQVPWKHGSDGIDGRALVFVTDSGAYLLFLNPYSANNADLTDRVLYAADRGDRNIELIDRMPDRTPYRQSASFRGDLLGPSEKPNTPTIEVTPLTVQRGREIELRARITNVNGASVVAAYLRFAGERRERWRTVATNSTKGAAYDVRWRLTLPERGGGDETDASGTVTLPLPAPGGSLQVGVGFGSSERQARRPLARSVMPFRVEDSSEIELLLPERRQRAEATVHGTKWNPVSTLPELSTATTVAAP